MGKKRVFNPDNPEQFCNFVDDGGCHLTGLKMECSYERCLLHQIWETIPDDMVEVSFKTAISSITALRHFNKKLQDDKELFEQEEGYSSSVERCDAFIEKVKKAYSELQKQTGDKTPLDFAVDR